MDVEGVNTPSPSTSLDSPPATPGSATKPPKPPRCLAATCRKRVGVWAVAAFRGFCSSDCLNTHAAAQQKATTVAEVGKKPFYGHDLGGDGGASAY